MLIDCGLDWRGRLEALRPRAIVLTHTHPDHAGGLRDGAPCPVYATEETWTALRRYPLDEREQVRAREPFTVGEIRLEAFRVEHSLLAPAVGYRVEAGRAALFYVPDLVSIDDERWRSRVSISSRDGSAIGRSIVRRRDGRPIGHASIRVQLDWCATAGVSRAVFTHCGSEIVKGDARLSRGGWRRFDGGRGLQAAIAHDGLTLTI